MHIDGGGGIVIRCRPLCVGVKEVEGDGVVMLRAVKSQEGVEAMLGLPGRAGVG